MIHIYSLAALWWPRHPLQGELFYQVILISINYSINDITRWASGSTACSSWSPAACSQPSLASSSGDTRDTWLHVTHDYMWHMTQDTWHVTHEKKIAGKCAILIFFSFIIHSNSPNENSVTLRWTLMYYDILTSWKIMF